MNKMMRSVIIFLCIICLTGCSRNHSSYQIDYGKSERYTKEDMDYAIGQIMKEFQTWDGCVMHTIAYAGDEKADSELSYCNEVGETPPYEQCMVFTSSFHSPKEGNGAWELDYEYDGWQWLLAKTSGGKWELLQWGY